MLTGIDHLVLAVPDLDAATTGYEQIGFTVVRGGRHPAATHNALIGFADGSYLELLAFYEPSPNHRWWGPRQQGDGLIDFCLATDDLPADIAAFRRAGVEMKDPEPGSRLRPDGYRVSWVLSLAGARHRGVAPFLIQDVTPREERVPRQTTHPNQVTGIGALIVAVEDIATVRQWYERTLGTSGQGVRRDDLDAAGVRFTVGPHRLEFVAPRTGRGPVADWLSARGPSPYAATLRTTSGKPGQLDERKTFGAHLLLV